MSYTYRKPVKADIVKP